jgi:hypothetical protein
MMRRNGSTTAACVLATMLAAGTAFGQQSKETTLSWQSAATGAGVNGELKVPQEAAGVLPTVIYLKNLAAPRIGQEADDPIIADMLKEGEQVLVLDYAKNPAAVSPAINLDINKLRQDITGKAKFLGDHHVDVAHLYVLPEGCRVKRNVPFFDEGGVKLAMDIFYPSQPNTRPPLLMEITCDNANRMGAGSLAFCRDTLIEGALLQGFATAMVDHPNPGKYPGFYTFPEGLQRMKAAVRTLRAEGPTLGTTDKIGVIGFSRGSPLATLLAVTGGAKEFEVGGLHPEQSSRVQAALIHGERYDYTALKSDDPMYKRYEKAWGTREARPELWEARSPIKYVTKDDPPMFLDTSNAEEPIYREQLAMFEKKLTEVGVPHEYQVDRDGRGHQVSLNPRTLESIYTFFGKYLKDAH